MAVKCNIRPFSATTLFRAENGADCVYVGRLALGKKSGVPELTGDFAEIKDTETIEQLGLTVLLSLIGFGWDIKIIRKPHELPPVPPQAGKLTWREFCSKFLNIGVSMAVNGRELILMPARRVRTGDAHTYVYEDGAAFTCTLEPNEIGKVIREAFRRSENLKTKEGQMV